MFKQFLQGEAVNEALMLTVDKVAEMLDCSTRHVYRLEEKGLMPSASRPGAIVRWSRKDIQEWIANGCLPVRTEAAIAV